MCVLEGIVMFIIITSQNIINIRQKKGEIQ